MNVIQEIFIRKKPVAEKLLAYGFVRSGESYVLNRDFMSGRFRVEVTVRQENVTARVIDMDTEEEYRQIEIPSYTGSYVSIVRENYRDILQDIADSCFTATVFISPQMARIAALIRERYGETEDHPFADSPEVSIFRCPDNRKWYGIVMSIGESRLKENVKKENDRIIEVMNVKIDPEQKDTILKMPGMHEAYHMNKKSWITITMDDSATDEDIMSLVDVSRRFAYAGGKKAVPLKEGSWIVPANPAYYDVISLFEKERDILWKQGAGIRKGDTVYMYVTAPIGCVLYRCRVTETDIPYEFSGENVRMHKVMKMDVTGRYEEGFCSMSRLRELGITSVRGPRKTTEQFVQYMK